MVGLNVFKITLVGVGKKYGFLLGSTQKVGKFKKLSILPFLKFKEVKVLKVSVFKRLNDLLKQVVGAISWYLLCDFKVLNWYCSFETRSKLKLSFLDLLVL